MSYKYYGIRCGLVICKKYLITDIHLCLYFLHRFILMYLQCETNYVQLENLGGLGH